MSIDVCMSIDGDDFCIPEDGLILLDQEQIPLCDLSAWQNISGNYLCTILIPFTVARMDDEACRMLSLMFNIHRY